MITLEEITHKNIYAVLALSVSETQQAYYPQSNSHSIAEGMFPADNDPVWMRAICEDGNPVGFMMTSELPEQGEYFLWRMMIDQHSQGRGVGVQAMNLLIKRVINNGNPQALSLSHLKNKSRRWSLLLELRICLHWRGAWSGRSDDETDLRSRPIADF